MAAYDAFISYSHAKDKPIAAALQSVVQKLGKPWYRHRALRVFRDDTSLSATPSLWPSIEQALGQSRFLILLASPEAATSAWVNKEVAFWLEHKNTGTLLIGVTDGELAWDNSIGDFALNEGKPLPPVLTGRFPTEPKWVDLRAYRDGANSRDTKFADLAAAVAATIHGMPKEDLLSQEVRQQRRALTLAWSSFSSLLVLAGALSWQWNNAVEQRNRADSTLAVATKTANTLVLDLAQEFRNRTGMPIDLVHKILDRAQDLQRRLAESGQTTPELRLSQAVALLEMATTLLALRDTDGALAAAKRSHDIFQVLWASQPENINLQLNLALSDDKIGDVFKTQAKYDEVLRSYRHGLDIMKALAAKDPGNTDWQHNVLLIGNKISNVLFLKGDLTGALASSRDSVAFVQALAAKDPANVLWQIGLSSADDVNGDLLREQGDFAGALASYRDGLAIRQALAVKDPGNAELQRALMLSENRIGLALAAQGDLAGALAAHRDALVIIKALVTSDPSNAEWQHHLSTCNERIGYVLKLQGDLAGALPSFRDGLAITKALAAKDPGNADLQNDASVFDEEIGDVLLSQGDLTGALAGYREGLAIRRELAAKYHDTMQWRRSVSVSLNKLSNALGLQSQSDVQGALAAYRESVQIMRELSAKDPGNVQWQKDLIHTKDGGVLILTKLGNVLKEQGDLAGALTAYREGLAIRRELAANDPSNTKRQFDVVGSLANFVLAGDDPSGRLRESLVILKTLEAQGRLSPEQKAWIGLVEAELAKFAQVDRAAPPRSPSIWDQPITFGRSQ